MLYTYIYCSPKYFSDLDTNPKKSVSSSEKSSKPGSRSLRTSPFKRSMDGMSF